LAGVALAVSLLPLDPVIAETQSGVIDVLITRPLVASEQQPINFGYLLVQAGTTIVQLDTSGALASASGSSASDSQRSAGVIRVSGTPDAWVQVDTNSSGSGSSCSNGASLLQVQATPSFPQIPAAGFVDISLGAALRLPGGIEGVFSCTYSIVVNYQ
jgi:hypothetical protein